MGVAVRVKRGEEGGGSRQTFDKSWFPEKDKSGRSESVGQGDAGKGKGVDSHPKGLAQFLPFLFGGMGILVEKVFELLRLWTVRPQPPLERHAVRSGRGRIG